LKRRTDRLQAPARSHRFCDPRKRVVQEVSPARLAGNARELRGARSGVCRFFG
jgi:hypothetical protein